MTTEEYRSAPGEHYSGLKHLLVSIPHFIGNRGKKTETTPAMQQGTWLHQWWLEGNEPVYAVKPAGMSFATKEGKRWRDDHAIVPIIDEDASELLIRRYEALQASTLAKSIRDAMISFERPMFASVACVPVKALFDGENDVAFCDLKTCQDNSPKAFGEHIVKYSYDLQWALYEAIWRENYGRRRKPKFYWITVSADKNPVVAVYNIGQFADLGREKLDMVLKRYRLWQNTGETPIDADVPYWAVEGGK